MADMKVNVNTHKGFNVIETDKITGNLIALIIKTRDPLNLKIVSENGYSMLDYNTKPGVEYFPLIIQPKDINGHGANYDNVFYFLDEKLVISISGGINKEMELIIRTE